MSDKVTEAILDFANALEAACVQLKRYMGEVHGIEPPSWDPTKIKWVQAEGTKGPYERYPAQGQKAESTEDYRNLLAAVKQHSMVRNGYFYWVFTDGATLGRKLKKGKEVKKTREAKTDVEAVKAKFPPDLAELLNFEVEEQFCILKPRTFLGSDNFAKIASIVRDIGGEYISAGKQSHFKVSKSIK